MRKLLTLAACAIMAVALSAVEPPTVTAVTPSPLVMSPNAQPLRVTGTGFAAGLTVEIQSHGNTQTYSGAAIQGHNATSFEVSVVLAQPGAASLIVRNTDGGVTEPFTLKVEVGKGAEPTRGPQAVPVIERVSPDKTNRSTVAQVLTLSGHSFSPAATVTMTDPTGVVTIIKGNSLEASTPTIIRFGATLDVSGDYTFTVTNPPGQASNTVTVVVGSPR
jgi:hypothetical protein